MRKLLVLFAALALLLTGGVAFAGEAQAAEKVRIGGGSPILILQGGNSASACTVTTVGRPTSGVHKGKLIALTAGHCGKPGQRVLSEPQQNRGVIGKFVYSASDLDIAVIELDETKVQPVRSVGGVTIRKIDTTPVQFPTVVCKEGRTTGHTCGIVWGSDNMSHISQMCVIEGDSGAPVVVGDRLVGMVNAYYFVSCIGPETGTSMGPIMHRLSQRGFGDFKPV